MCRCSCRDLDRKPKKVQGVGIEGMCRRYKETERKTDSQRERESEKDSEREGERERGRGRGR